MRMKLLFFAFVLGQLVFLNAQQDGQKDFLHLTREKHGRLSLSIVVHKRTLMQIVEKVGESLQAEVIVSDSLRKEMSQKIINVFLLRRSLRQSLAFLSGIVNCNYSLRKKQLILYKIKNNTALEQEIITEYKKYLLTSPSKTKQAHIYFSLGTFLFLQSKIKAAFNEYNTLFQQFPQSQLRSYTLLMMARCLLEEKQPDRAKKVLTRFFNKYSQSKLRNYAFIMFARCHESQHDFSSAIQVYRYLLSSDDVTDKDFIKLKLGQAYAKRGDYQRARDTFRKILDGLPKGAPLAGRISFELIQCCLKLELGPEILSIIQEFYRNSTRKHPLYMDVRMLHAQLAYKKKQYFVSYYLLKALFVCSNKKIRLRAYLLGAKNLIGLAKYSQATQLLKDGIHSAPPTDVDTYALWHELGSIYLKMKRWTSARAAFDKIVGNYEDSVYLRIMQCDYNAQDYHGCLRGFRSFVKKIKTTQVLSDAFYLAGQCYLRLGDVEKAKDMFQGKWQN